MQWNPLTENGQIEAIIQNSFSQPQLIFKHSTTCSISKMVLARVEKETKPEDIQFHYLDLLNNRQLSNYIAEKFGIPHESPQVLLIKNGKCIYNESHYGIMMYDIIKHAQ